MEFITELKDNEIFVFGSNEAGRHGAGAAKQAAEEFGAVYGQGYGLQGQSFAIPTKDKNLKTLPLCVIHEYVKSFLSYARARPELVFLVTPIGTGLAGISPCKIGKMFTDCPSNVILPPEFKNGI